MPTHYQAYVDPSLHTCQCDLFPWSTLEFRKPKGLLAYILFSCPVSGRKKKRKTLGNDICFLQSAALLKDKYFQFPRFLFAQLLRSAKELNTRSFIWLQMLLLWCSGHSHTHSGLKQATVGVSQSTGGQAAWNNGPFLSSPPTPCWLNLQSWENRKDFLPTTSSKSFSLPGLQLPQLWNEEIGLADL